MVFVVVVTIRYIKIKEPYQSILSKSYECDLTDYSENPGLLKNHPQFMNIGKRLAVLKDTMITILHLNMNVITFARDNSIFLFKGPPNNSRDTPIINFGFSEHNYASLSS
jgi:hypothetical protein